MSLSVVMFILILFAWKKRKKKKEDIVCRMHGVGRMLGIENNAAIMFMLILFVE